MTYMGKESKREIYVYMYIYITDPLCCTAEIKYNIVDQLYPSKNLKIKYLLV